MPFTWLCLIQTIVLIGLLSVYWYTCRRHCCKINYNNWQSISSWFVDDVFLQDKYPRMSEWKEKKSIYVFCYPPCLNPANWMVGRVFTVRRLSLMKGVVKERLPIFPHQLSCYVLLLKSALFGPVQHTACKSTLYTVSQQPGGEKEKEVRGTWWSRKGSFTWTGGGEHGHGMGVVVPPAVPLNELLLAL